MTSKYQKAVWVGVDETTNLLNSYANVPFYIDGLRYESLWQYYMAMKTLSFKRYDFFKQMFASDGSHAVQSPAITLADHDLWAAVQEKVILRGLEAKYRQNVAAAEVLKQTKDANILVHQGSDLYWGTGITLEEAKSDDLQQFTFPGFNRLGELLMHVRSNLP